MMWPMPGQEKLFMLSLYEQPCTLWLNKSSWFPCFGETILWCFWTVQWRYPYPYHTLCMYTFAWEVARESQMMSLGKWTASSKEICGFSAWKKTYNISYTDELSEVTSSRVKWGNLTKMTLDSGWRFQSTQRLAGLLVFRCQETSVLLMIMILINNDGHQGSPSIRMKP